MPKVNRSKWFLSKTTSTRGTLMPLDLNDLVAADHPVRRFILGENKLTVTKK